MATASQRQGLANVKSLVEGIVGQRVLFDSIIDAMQTDIVYQVLAEQTLLIMKEKGIWKEPKAEKPAQPTPATQTVPEASPVAVEKKEDLKQESAGTHFENGKVVKNKTAKKSTSAKKPAQVKKAPASGKKAGKK